MSIISKEEFLKDVDDYRRKISEGAVFIYPTDTIYGIGCDATNPESVLRIRKIKHRESNPFSVAAPSKEWIRKNCVLSAHAEKWLEKLPGPYTLLLKLRNKNAVAEQVGPGTGVLGVRMPGNWFCREAAHLKIPIVSTSANVTGQQHMRSIEDLNREVSESADFIVYEGHKEGRPSSLVRLTGDEPEIIKR